MYHTGNEPEAPESLPSCRLILGYVSVTSAKNNDKELEGEPPPRHLPAAPALLLKAGKVGAGEAPAPPCTLAGKRGAASVGKGRSLHRPSSSPVPGPREHSPSVCVVAVSDVLGVRPGGRQDKRKWNPKGGSGDTSRGREMGGPPGGWPRFTHRGWVARGWGGRVLGGGGLGCSSLTRAAHLG